MENQTQDNAVVTRRLFLTVTITGFAGMFSIPLFEEEAEAQVRDSGGVVAYMRTFAAETGFVSSGQTIDAYKQNLSKAKQEDVNKVIAKMKLSHFNDFGASVHSFGSEGRFFYTAKHQDRFDGCAGFYDGQNSTNRAVMEGPTLVGLALAAQLLKQENKYTTEAARRQLYPTKIGKNSRGNFTKGFEHPDTHYTQDGVFHSNYVAGKMDPVTKEGVGTITITAIHERKNVRKVVLDKDLDIKYRYV